MISFSCPKCGHFVYAQEDALGAEVACPGCQQAIRVPASSAEAGSGGEPVTQPCPQCGRPLRLARELAGRRVRCNGCQTRLDVSADPWQLTVVDGEHGHGTASAPPAVQAMPVAPPPPSKPASPAAAPAPPRVPAAAVPQNHASDPPPVKPPPLPPSGSAPQGTAQDDLLAGYGGPAKSTGTEIKDKLQAGFQGMKKRASAMKLKHEAKNLHTAVNEQCEKLGVMAVNHRPAGVPIEAELQELARIKDELAQKEMTLESLRQTKGSRQAARPLQQEVAQLHDRQRELLIEIGRKVETAQADMPEAAGHYSALAHLRSALQTKESELAAVEEQIGPLPQGRDLAFRPSKKLLVTCGGVLGGIVVLWMLWGLASAALVGDALPGWGRDYIPSGAAGVFYFDMKKIRSVDTDIDLEELASEAHALPSGLQVDDIDEVFGVVLGGDDAFFLVRTQEDLPLDDLVTDKQSQVEEHEYRDTPYLHVRQRGYYGPGVYMAKTDANTYCFAQSEDHLKDALGCWTRKEGSQLDEDIQQALTYAQGDHLFVMGGGDLPLEEVPVAAFRGLKAAGIGFTVSSSNVSLEGAIIFRKNGDAEDCVEQFERMKDQFSALLENAPIPPEERESFEKGVGLLDELEVYQDGNAVCFEGSWKTADLEDMAKQMGGSPF